VKESAKPGVPAGNEGVNVQFDARLPRLSAWRRAQIPLIAGAVYGVVRTIAPTIRFELLGERYHRPAVERGERVIVAFWHRCIFSAVWLFRGRGAVVMNTTNFDGQWTRRVIERLGYGTAQGSSTRGGLSGLMAMGRALEEGHDVAFTIDGPRGPRYVAKPGPVMLARQTGQPIFVFHIGLENAWTLEKTWDQFQVPQPFTRAVAVAAPLIYVPPDADSEMIHQKQAEMQAALDRVRDIAEGWFRSSPEEKERWRRELNGA
jgi:lysophospholipid acyltransferase (LPLAT)-like uncharacterized protein